MALHRRGGDNEREHLPTSDAGGRTITRPTATSRHLPSGGGSRIIVLALMLTALLLANPGLARADEEETTEARLLARQSRGRPTPPPPQGVRRRL